MDYTVIRDGIITALKNAYPTVPVYDEIVKEGLETPSFLVTCVSVTKRRLLDIRWRFRYVYNVQYFTAEDEEPNGDTSAVWDALPVLLEFIPAAEGGFRLDPESDGDQTEDFVAFTAIYETDVIIPEGVPSKNMRTYTLTEEVGGSILT